MATQTIASITRTHGAVVVTWAAMGSADDGTPFSPPPGYACESAQFTGTFTTATAKLHGSNQDPPVAFAAVTAGVTAGAIAPILAQTLYYKPVTTGGTSESVVAIAYFRQVS